MIKEVISIPYFQFQYDPDSGNYLLRVRPYNPQSGRFLSEEPLGVDGPNLYWYTLNNPVNFIDPSGLIVTGILGSAGKSSPGAVGGAIIGGTVGGIVGGPLGAFIGGHIGAFVGGQIFPPGFGEGSEFLPELPPVNPGEGVLQNQDPAGGILNFDFFPSLPFTKIPCRSGAM